MRLISDVYVYTIDVSARLLVMKPTDLLNKTETIKKCFELDGIEEASRVAGNSSEHFPAVVL